MKHSLFLVLTLSLSPLLYSQEENPPLEKTLNPCLMTIFVHGTIKPAKFSLSMVLDVFNGRKNKIEQSLYARMTQYLRNNNCLHQSQPMQELGLAPIETHHAESRQGAHCIKNLFEMQYDFYNLYPICRRYYTFGWSGLLNAKSRLEEGENFYKALKKEVFQLRQNGYEPTIHINAFSHGGSVALNMAAARQEKDEEPPFIIDQLVLLATPVHQETDILTIDPLFKKIFHMYSASDDIQPNDFLTTQKTFRSGGTFVKRAGFALPKDLTQVQLRITKEVRRLPKEYDKKTIATMEKPYTLLEQKGIKRIHQDPQHTEFYDLGWGDSWYRTYFNLYPLPILAFVPTLIHTLKEYASDAHDVTFDYCPSLNGTRLLINHAKHGITVPFLSKKILEEMKESAKACEPEDFSKKDCQAAALKAFEQAYEDLKQETKTKKYQKRLRTSYLSLVNRMGTDFFPNA